MIQRRVRPLWTPVATSSTRRGRRLRHERLSLRRTSEGACRTAGGRHSTSDGRNCAALVSALDPPEMVAAEPLCNTFLVRSPADLMAGGTYSKIAEK